MSGESLPLRRENCRKLHRQHTVWRWTFSTVLAALFMIFVCFVWFSWARIGNDSMAPTLKKGDLVLVDRIYKYCYEIGGRDRQRPERFPVDRREVPAERGRV